MWLFVNVGPSCVLNSTGFCFLGAFIHNQNTLLVTASVGQVGCLGLASASSLLSRTLSRSEIHKVVSDYK